MSFFDSLLKKEKKKDLGVCIPEHKQKKKKSQNKTKTQENTENDFLEEIDNESFIMQKNLVRVKGIFSFQNSFTVIGTITAGKLKKGMKLVTGNKKLKIVSIEVNGKQVKQAVKGDKVSINFDEYSKDVFSGQVIELK